jgi:DNA-binding XRE family transcriptional regulator
MKTHDFGKILDDAMADPRRRAEIERERDEAVAEITAYNLAEVRKALELTQVELARRLEVSQPTVSQAENADDMKVSTLADHIEAMGGRLQLAAVFPDSEGGSMLTPIVVGPFGGVDRTVLDNFGPVLPNPRGSMPVISTVDLDIGGVSDSYFAEADGVEALYESHRQELDELLDLMADAPDRRVSGDVVIRSSTGEVLYEVKVARRAARR